MRRVTISKEWRFDAAHQLPNHDGKCATPHGHTYTVAVGLTGYPQPPDGRPEEGMVADFAVLDGIWRRQLEPLLDHQDLNVSLVGHLPPTTGPHGADVPLTTSEHLATWIYEVFSKALDAGAVDVGRHVQFVRVSETPSTYAEVTRYG